MALFPDPEHYRTWVDWAKALTPIVKSSSAVKPVKLLPYGYDRLPNPSEDGMVVFLLDDISGAIPVYSEGGHWKRFSDDSIVGPTVVVPSSAFELSTTAPDVNVT